jgi:hypothetical protein
VLPGRAIDGVEVVSSGAQLSEDRRQLDHFRSRAGYDENAFHELRPT